MGREPFRKLFVPVHTQHTQKYVSRKAIVPTYKIKIITRI